MANKLYEESSIQGIADAIRAKGQTGTMTVAQMAGKIAAISPTLQNKTATANGTVTPDSGYDGLSSVTVAIPEGSEGTPTATKGSVSNHSITITPTVTNTTGYITGSTKTGSGVTVSASELVSGSETKTANGTYDVTNLAEVVVNVPTSEPVLDTLSVTQNGTYTPPSGTDGYNEVIVNVSGGGETEVIPFTATANGVYTAQTGKAYSPVTVAIPIYEGGSY